jgi:hypothetical protein
MFKSISPIPSPDSGATPSAPNTNQLNTPEPRSPFNLPQAPQPVPNPEAGIFNPIPPPETVMDYTPLIGRLFNIVEAATDAVFEPVQTLGDSTQEPIQAALGPSQQPRVIVMDSPMESGFSALIGGDAMNSKGTRLAERQPAIKAHQLFDTQFGVDKHFVSYGVIPPTHPMAVNNTMQECPRLSKASLSYLVNDLRIIPDINHVVGLMIVVDMDLPGHARWETDLGYTKTYTEHFANLAQTNKVLSKPSAFYKTRSGARLVYILSRPIPVTGKGGLEDKIGGMIHDFYLAGIPVDYQCMDWTRLFRANNVTRENDDEPALITGRQPYYSLSFGSVKLEEIEAVPDKLIAYDPNYFGNISDKNVLELQHSHHSVARSLAQEPSWCYKYNFEAHNRYAVSAPMAHIDLPSHLQITDAEVTKIIKEGENDSLFADIKAKFKNHRKQNLSDYVAYIYEAIFGDGTVFLNQTALEGFHGGLLKTARGFMNILFKDMDKHNIDVGYTFIYACILQAAIRSNNLRVQENRSDARSLEHIKKEVADICSYHYRNIKGELEQEKKQTEEQGQYSFFMEQKVSLENSPEELARKDLTNFFGEDMVTEHFKRLIVLHNAKHGDFVYKIEKNGYGHYVNCADQDIVISLATCGHNFVNIENAKRAFDEDPTAKQRRNIYLETGFGYSKMIYSRIIKDVEPLVKEHPHGSKIEVYDKVPGMRTDIVPRYSAQVAKWLELIGGSQIEKLLDWLASFPMIRWPNCALFIEATAKIGKDLLAAGLQAVTESRKYAEFEKIIGDFQDDLIETPFIWLNEGIDEAAAKKNIAARFKTLVTDKTMKINPKGRPMMDIEGHNRLLITGNNDRVLHITEDLTGADTDAIADRLLHIKPDDAAAASKYILNTNTQSNEELGIESNYWADYELPAHIMHLHQERAQRILESYWSKEKESRFLVPGELTEFHKKLALNTGNMEMVVQFLGTLMSDSARAQNIIKIMPERLELRVHAGALVDTMQKLPSTEHRNLRAQSIKQVIKTLAKTGAPINTRLINGSASVRCYAIDLAELIEKLYISGNDCDFRDCLSIDTWNAVTSDEIKAYVNEVDESDGTPMHPVNSVPIDAVRAQVAQQQQAKDNNTARPF